MLTLDALTLTQDDFRLTADFKIPTGTRAAVIGPSGAGKSTLLAAIAGFLTPESGGIRWQSSDLTETGPGNRPIAMLFQDNNLFPHLTAAQNVALGLRPNLRLARDETKTVSAALSRVGLADHQSRKPAQLSGGQQSRVALARVLVQSRPLILLDEPFAALGPALKAEMLDLVAELLDETNATLLMVSHDPADARRIADQTILVADGTAHPPTDTKALLDTPPEALKAYLG
ncbi:ATP-binding cassette domain-containing protein [Shimia haliotis]|uniref:Thiamine transport system ATP-binding protein n=1 Tax=Shimia haliotis TaxID=1280847 RepID=A0A1I4EET8_9RHOB|nr:ATP-binding cassette domain-containing protein [Shimia haliotis]SFL02876.1 thiamine transport system ATP-binding protein [Shimia haliotis]